MVKRGAFCSVNKDLWCTNYLKKENSVGILFLGFCRKRNLGNDFCIELRPRNSSLYFLCAMGRKIRCEINSSAPFGQQPRRGGWPLGSRLLRNDYLRKLCAGNFIRPLGFFDSPASWSPLENHHHHLWVYHVVNFLLVRPFPRRPACIFRDSMEYL